MQGFKQTRLLSEGEVYLHLGSDAKVAAVAVGDFHLSFRNGRTLILKDCLYAPFIRRNLISVSSLVSSGYSVNFNKSVIIRMNGDFICSGLMIDSLYIISPNPIELHANENSQSIVPFSNKRKHSSPNSKYLWHLRLGHVSLGRINRLVKTVYLDLPEKGTITNL